MVAIVTSGPIRLTQSIFCQTAETGSDWMTKSRAETGSDWVTESKAETGADWVTESRVVQIE